MPLNWNWNLSNSDLIIVVAVFSRLCLFFVWDKICLVELRKSLTLSLQDLSYEAYWYLWDSLSDLKSSLKQKRRDLFVYFFGYQDFFITMEDTKKKFVCGMGGPSSNLGRVHIDNACVVVQNLEKEAKYMIQSQVSECYNCPNLTIWDSSPHKQMSEILGNNSFQVNTRYPNYLNLYKDGGFTCAKEFHFEQYGVYGFSLEDCSVTVTDKPVNAFLPLFWGLVVLCVLAGLRLTYQSVYKTSAFRRFMVWITLRSEPTSDLEAEFADTSELIENPEILVKTSRRLRSLDSFRGLAISVMIFVNYGGGSYYFFNHSPWNGLTVADLVFPWFIWIMGVSIAISTQSQLRKSLSRRKIVRRVFFRSFCLVLLGLILNSDGGRNDLRTLRIPGVLQRFGLTYLVVAFFEALLLPKEYPAVEQRGASSWFLDLSSAGVQWLLTLLTGGLHAIITYLLPVPNCPTGYLGPGGLADNQSYTNCTGGAAMWVDIKVFGANHIYQSPTCKPIYQTVTPYDPEGLLGALNSMVLCWLGVAAGRILLVHPGWQARVKRWLVFSVLCGVAAAGLAGFSKNDGICPINKNLWSLSFILSTAGMAFLLLTVMYILIDVFKFWSGSPLYFAGMNSILLYMGHEMVSGMLPWSWKPFSGSHTELLFMNMWGAGLWILTSYILYTNQLFFAL